MLPSFERGRLTVGRLDGAGKDPAGNGVARCFKTLVHGPTANTGDLSRKHAPPGFSRLENLC